jgi:hypothetical protein
VRVRVRVCGVSKGMSNSYESVSSRVGAEDPNHKRLSWIVFSPAIFAPVIPLTRVIMSRWGKFSFLSFCFSFEDLWFFVLTSLL